MVEYFSVEYKTFIIVAESLPQVDLGLYREIFLYFLKGFCKKMVINIYYFGDNKVISAT